MLWIIVAVVVVALATFAFWPHRRGVVDGKVSRSRGINEGRYGSFDGGGGGL
jgi:hypothetical protein